MIIKEIRIWIACRRLNRMVARQRASFAVQDFARRRKAGKLGWQRRGLA